MEQVVACALVTQWARVRFPVGTGFLGEFFFFRSFSSPVRQMSGSFRPPKVPDYHLAVVIIIPYSLCCEPGVSCLSCLCCLGGGPGIGLISLIRGGPPCPSVVKKSMYVIHSCISSADRSWLCKARAAWVT